MRILLIAYAGVLLLLSTKAWALIKFEDAVFPELAVSARAQAMGNAFIARTDDAAAAFYNPAGLGSVRGRLRFSFSSFHLEASKDLLQASTAGGASDIGSNVTKGFDIEKTRQLLLDNRGTIAHSRIHLLPNITYRYFSAGFLYSRRSRATIGTEDTAKYEFAERTDLGPYASMNISLWGGILKFGASGILLRRKEIIDETDRDTALELESNDFNKGNALMITGGARLTLPIEFLPTFAATMHNMAGSKFSSSGAGAPEKKQQSMDLGFSLTPQIGKATRVHFEINWKDFGNRFKDVKTSRKIGLGMELDFARVAFLRLGYGDGWGSGGLGVRGKSFEFNLTSYAIDATSAEFRGREDRRFSMELSAGF